MKRLNASKTSPVSAVLTFLIALVIGAAAWSGGIADSRASDTFVAGEAIVLAQVKMADPKAAATPSRTATVKLPPALQSALKRGDRNAAMSLASQTLKGRPGGGTKYECKSGNCACAGVSDCMNMVVNDKACKEGTVGCNDNGCTCQGN
jgi:hypothetical protein